MHRSPGCPRSPSGAGRNQQPRRTALHRSRWQERSLSPMVQQTVWATDQAPQPPRRTHGGALNYRCLSWRLKQGERPASPNIPPTSPALDYGCHNQSPPRSGIRWKRTLLSPPPKLEENRDLCDGFLGLKAINYDHSKHISIRARFLGLA